MVFAKWWLLRVAVACDGAGPGSSETEKVVTSGMREEGNPRQRGLANQRCAVGEHEPQLVGCATALPIRCDMGCHSLAYHGAS